MQNDFWEPPRLVLHTVRQGDTMYHIAKEYNTTVPSIQALNPQTDLLNIQMGTAILLMPGSGYVNPNKIQIATEEQPPTNVFDPLNDMEQLHNLDDNIQATTQINENAQNPLLFSDLGIIKDNTNPTDEQQATNTNAKFIPVLPKNFQDTFKQAKACDSIPDNNNKNNGESFATTLTKMIQNNFGKVSINGEHKTAVTNPLPNIEQRGNVTFTKMRFVWTQHVYWTRMLLISLTERLRDQDAVSRRLMENPVDIGGMYLKCCGRDSARTINNLISEHLRIGGELISAMRDRRNDVDILKRRLYANAEKMADAFSLASTIYDREILKKFFDKNLDLTIQQINMRLSGNHRAEILAFGEIEKESMALADYLSSGI